LTFTKLVDEGVATVSLRRRRSAVIDKDESAAQPEQDIAMRAWVSTEFWDYVDHLLSDIRADASKEATSDARKKCLES